MFFFIFQKALDENDFIKDDDGDDKESEQSENMFTEKESFEYPRASFHGAPGRVLDNKTTSLYTTTLSSSDNLDTLHTLGEEEINTNTVSEIQTGKSPRRLKLQRLRKSLDSQSDKDSHKARPKCTESGFQEVGMRYDVSVDCAICLNSYSVGDKVTCSSALSPCLHIFHQDCIVEWLMTLGKKAHRDIQGTNDTILQQNVYNFPMICPICRQDFIPNSISE